MIHMTPPVCDWQAILITDIKVQSEITYLVHSNVWIAVKEQLQKKKAKEKNVISWFRWLIDSWGYDSSFSHFFYIFISSICWQAQQREQESVISDIILVYFCYSI